ncbi:MAG TPA: prolipoprotein diacylglyceryl transferase [Myxococcota bacterium]|nr:prolipoprotein diacylglyceryl transferase [Myxococcota bacterium]
MEPLIPYFQVPVIHIGPLPIHGFGMLVALGFILGGNVAQWRAERAGLDREAINKLLGYLVIGTFVGGHVGYGLMYEPREYLSNPIKFLQFWQGLSSFGGFVVCVPLSFWFFRHHKLPVWPYMDSLAIGLSLGWFFGRMGCTVAHDHPGTPSNFFLAKYCRPVVGHTLELPSWMVDDHMADLRWGPCRAVGDAVTSVSQQVPADFGGVVAAHDMGFYEALWSISVLGLFLLMDRVARRPGVYVTLLGVLYAPVRFGMDFLRPESSDVRYLSLTPAQWWAIVFFVAAIYGLVTRLRSSDRPIGPTDPLTPAEGGYDPETGAGGVT